MSNITFVKGDILDSEAEALVNPVNCVGVMGKGLALQFKSKFPTMFQQYETLCISGCMKLGYVCPVFDGDSLIILFPTKGHWRFPSRPSDIRAGLMDLRHLIESRHIGSIAIPALGCGNGGVLWTETKKLISEHLGSIDCKVEVYEPVI